MKKKELKRIVSQRGAYNKTNNKKYVLEFTAKEMIVLANAVGATIPLFGNHNINPLDFNVSLNIRNKLLDEVLRKENL